MDMAAYMARRREDRRRRLREMLGGACNQCQSVESLQFDHIDPSTKSFTISNLPYLDGPWEKLVEEAKKCQLLCQSCHIEKTRGERSVEHGGGKTGKGRCHCELCGPLKNQQINEYRYRTGLRKKGRRGGRPPSGAAR